MKGMSLWRMKVTKGGESWCNLTLNPHTDSVKTDVFHSPHFSKAPTHRSSSVEERCIFRWKKKKLFSISLHLLMSETTTFWERENQPQWCSHYAPLFAIFMKSQNINRDSCKYLICIRRHDQSTPDDWEQKVAFCVLNFCQIVLPLGSRPEVPKAIRRRKKKEGELSN